MRFGQGVIDLERLEGGWTGQRRPFRHGHPAVVDLKGVRVREPGVGERVGRIVVDRLLEVRNRFAHALLAALVPAEPALQVQGIRLDVVGVAPRGWVRDRSEEHTSELQSHSDLVCRLLLEKKKKARNIKNIHLSGRLDYSHATSKA